MTSPDCSSDLTSFDNHSGDVILHHCDDDNDADELHVNGDNDDENDDIAPHTNVDLRNRYRDKSETL